MLPALLGGAEPAEVKLLERLAAFWGLSYQALDDLKDVFQQAEQTGKTVARDASLNRPNLALAIGAPNAYFSGGPAAVPLKVTVPPETV